MDILDYFLWLWYKFIGFTECHQMIERTLRFDEKYLFLCSRCSGIYTGYFISYMFIWFAGKRKSGGFPPGKVILTGIILSSLMFIDVGTAFFELRTGTNDIRIITGLLAGFSVAFLVFPILNRLLFEPPDDVRVLDSLTQYLYVLGINLFAFLLIKTEWSILFYVFFTIISTGLILLYINLNSIVLLLLLRLIKIKMKTFYIILIAIIMSFIEKLAIYNFILHFLNFKN